MHTALFLNTPNPTILALTCARIALPIIALAVGVIILIALPQLHLQASKKNKYQHLVPGACITTRSGDQGIVETITDTLIVMHHHDGRKIEITKQAIAHIHHEKS